MQENEAACLKDRRLFLGIKFEFKWTWAQFSRKYYRVQNPPIFIHQDNLRNFFRLSFLKNVTKVLFQQEVVKDV